MILYVIHKLIDLLETCYWKHMPLQHIYEGESNENRKSEIKIRNITPLSYKLADMLPML
jgi:hypothetical protein